METLTLLWGTVWLRPYVFIFLFCYLGLGTLDLGLGRTLVFLVLGYLVAWAAEFSAIHTGFPFGRYIYIPATLDQELWVLGVPFMDSLSYVFLAYASFATARLALGGLRPGAALDGSWGLTILAATLMMTLDVIIDPVALRGYRWFLGQIYGYPEPGIYFGIPLSNFAGWWLVAAVMIRLLQALLASLPPRPPWSLGQGRRPLQALLGPALYLGILAFNLAVTFWIDEPLLGWVGLFIYIPFLTWLGVKVAAELNLGEGRGTGGPPSPSAPPPTPYRGWGGEIDGRAEDRQSPGPLLNCASPPAPPSVPGPGGERPQGWRARSGGAAGDGASPAAASQRRP
jgi:putative membrane protein